MQNKQQNFVAALSSGLVALIAIAAFTLSFSAIRDVAVKNGVAPTLAFLLPSVIDGAIIVFSLAQLVETLKGQTSKQLWALILTFTTLSIGFNIAHVNFNSVENNYVAIAIAIAVPTTLFFAFHTLMQQVESVVQGGVNATISKLQLQLKNMQSSVNTFRTNNIELQSTLDSVQGKLEKLQQRYEDGQVKHRKLQEQNKALKSQGITVQEQLQLLEVENGELKSQTIVPQVVLPIVKDVLQLIADPDNHTGKEIAERHGVDAAKITRMKKWLCG